MTKLIIKKIRIRISAVLCGVACMTVAYAECYTKASTKACAEVLRCSGDGTTCGYNEYDTTVMCCNSTVNTECVTGPVAPISTRYNSGTCNVTWLGIGVCDITSFGPWSEPVNTTTTTTVSGCGS